MVQKKTHPTSDDDHVDPESRDSQPVPASRMSSRENDNGKSTTNETSMLSSEQVSNFMISLGNQENINASRGATPTSEQVREFMMSNTNLRPQPMMRPGAVPVGAFSDDEDVLNLDASEVSEPPIVAHLAPDEADVEARITERLQQQINQRLHERMRLTHAVNSNIIVADEVKDELIPESNKRRTGIMVTLVCLVVGSGIGGLVYALLQDNAAQEALPKGDPLSPSSAPSSSFSFDSLDPLVGELKPFIAPTQEDLFPFMDPASPQSQALSWLQEDPITLTAGRLTRTALERYTLAVLYYATNGPSWNNYHLNRDDVCTWHDPFGENTPADTWNGVVCSETGGPISLILPDNNLVGPIPSELILLTNLKVINLNFNRLSGSIPTRISELTALEAFGVNSNRLKGALPPTFSPVMSTMDLSANSLTGSIPEGWGVTMLGLQYVDVSLNTITGSIPTTMGQLSKLVSLAVTDNQLTGTIPVELGRLSLLETLHVRRNWLTGSVPSELEQLSALQSLDIAGNSFIGSLNETICGLSGLSFLRADCKEIDCPCCTLCCDDDTGSVCQDMTE